MPNNPAVLACAALLLSACQPPPPHAPVTAATAPAAAPTPPPPVPGRFSALGCTVTLKGGWARLGAEETTQSSWAIQSTDGRTVLTVLSMPWRPHGPPADWRPDLDAIISLRRASDLDEHGAKAILSAPEYIPDRVSPGELYTLSDPENGDTLATMAKGSTARVCVLFLTQNNAQPTAFLDYARSVLAATAVDP